MMSADFYLATGEERYRTTTLEALRMVLRYGLKPDGRRTTLLWAANLWRLWELVQPIFADCALYLSGYGLPAGVAPFGETHLCGLSTQCAISTIRKRVFVPNAPTALTFETDISANSG